MNKELLFNQEARENLKLGVETLVKAVGCTLGPKGRNVIIDEGMYPHVTKDGVSVAKSIKLKNKFQNVGLQIVKNASVKTCEDAGDGTTTSIILANAIINSGLKCIEQCHSPNDINKGIDFAVNEVTKYIKEHTLEVTDERIRQIATISANNDSEIGNLVADTFIKVTKDGVISVESAKGSETTVEFVKGINIDRGYLSQYFVTNPETMECILDNPYVMVCKEKLTNVNAVLKVLESVYKQNRSLLLVVDDIDSVVLDTLVMNKIKNNLKLCVIKSPFNKEYLEGICALVGCNDYSSGECDKIIITKTQTSIIGGKGDLSKFDFKDPSVKAKLTCGAAVIKVGASSEIELLEKRDRIEDAICAVRAASEEGIVIGGGFTYLMAMKYMPSCEDESLQPGADIVLEALKAPFEQIKNNAGIDVDLLSMVVASEQGFNAKKLEFSNLLDDGVIDPAKVSRVALENAASVAKMFLTTECVICNE